MLKEAVPYDFGGIDVIDELPLPPPQETDAKESEKEDTESTTQSTVSGPDEPSLRNVVTAAEDFIKVLATVSTSQSSTADPDKSEAPGSEKKKRKNTGKKKKTAKKQKGKGKWRKRKQKAEAGIKIEEGTAVSTSGSKAEEAKALSNFISESHKHDQSSKNINRVGDSGYELGGKDESSNGVMKDEPATDNETVFIMSPATVQKKPEPTAEITLSTSTRASTAAQQRAKTRRLRKGWRKKSKTVPPPPSSSSEVLSMNTTDISVPTVITITPVAQPEQQSSGSDTEKRPGVSTARTPIVSPKVKRNRSKERGDREGRKKRRKDSSASPIVAAPDETSSMDHLKVIPLTGSPTEPPVSHRLDVYGGKTIVRVTSLNSSFSVLKMQKLQERGLKSSRRKTVLPLSSRNSLFHQNENVLLVLPSPETSDAISRPTEGTETHGEWRLYTTITVAPSITTKRHRQTIRQQRKSRKKAKAAAVSDGVPVLEQTEQTPMTFTTTAPSKVATTGELNLWRSDKTSMTTSATPVMSPIQLSIERAKAQFSRKKRRKAALSMRQQ